MSNISCHAWGAAHVSVARGHVMVVACAVTHVHIYVADIHMATIIVGVSIFLVLLLNVSLNCVDHP